MSAETPGVCFVEMVGRHAVSLSGLNAVAAIGGGFGIVAELEAFGFCGADYGGDVKAR